MTVPTDAGAAPAGGAAAPRAPRPGAEGDALPCDGLGVALAAAAPPPPLGEGRGEADRLAAGLAEAAAPGQGAAAAEHAAATTLEAFGAIHSGLQDCGSTVVWPATVTVKLCGPGGADPSAALHCSTVGRNLRGTRRATVVTGILHWRRGRPRGKKQRAVGTFVKSSWKA